MKITKRKKEFQSKLKKDQEYTLQEAIALLKETSKVKFVESLIVLCLLVVVLAKANKS